MSAKEGLSLLHAVAERVLARYLAFSAGNVRVVDPSRSGRLADVDLSYRAGDGRQVAVKVKADPYLGEERRLIEDRRLSFYRARSKEYAFEAAVDRSASRSPGWALRSEADELFYYRLTLSQTPREVAALMAEPDLVFFAELALEDDDLHILPMQETRSWLAKNLDRYPARPVASAGKTSWVRLVPRSDVEEAVRVRVIGPVFQGLRESA